MNKLIILFSFLSSSALAGDGGFNLWTCISDSGRTNLTIYVDNYSDAKVPARVVFGIDGQFLNYDDYRYDIERPANEVCEDDCTNVSVSNNQVTVNNGDYINMTVNLKGNKATIEKGFFDPRPEYQNSGATVGSISLTCKTFEQAP